jgi:hypothetical protein
LPRVSTYEKGCFAPNNFRREGLEKQRVRLHFLQLLIYFVSEYAIAYYGLVKLDW